MASLWNIRRLGRSKLAHRAATAMMQVVFPHDHVAKIWRGPLRGWRWYRHRDHQFWMPLGLYEEETCRWLQSNLGEGSVLFDIGANAGYFTLLGSKLVGASGRVVAFEPVPINVDVLQRQVDHNGCANVTIESSAISNHVGSVLFDIEGRNANSHLTEIDLIHAQSAPTASVEVACTTLDTWVADNGIQPDVLKIDVEGAETLVLEGAVDTLAHARPRIVLSTHSVALRDECTSVLEAANYQVIRLPGFEHELLGYPRR